MANKLWGGRFDKKTDPLVEEFTKSIHYDFKLAAYDLVGSMVHVEILRKAGYLTAGEAARLHNGLKYLHAQVIDGKFKPDDSSEDIHTDIQNKLYKRIGGLALKLHTARSRNDQVVFATKLYSKTELLKLTAYISELEMALGQLAEKNGGLIIPGFTHMQHAQPVYLADYLASYSEMLKRDYDRLWAIAGGIKLTMGAGAMAGTPIGAASYIVKASGCREMKKITGQFEIQPARNSLDAVSDRDFVIDILSALSILGMHLSRFSEDMIIWSTKEFGFVEIDDAFCTGSSLMPQKKNADTLEIVRGYAGRMCGNLVSVLTMMKGLPLAYNRDMQLDKEPLFNSLEIALIEINILNRLVKTIKFNKANLEEALDDESLYATDLVYHLVDKGAPFKTAHTIIGKLVKYSVDNSILIKTMMDSELKKFSDKLVRKDVIKLFNPRVSVESRKSVRR
ncbi:MAG: argininosuccinate lyase [Candidatus Omnitrophota bacterium]|nr:argininosuccinate lyase [Candidatus Omnitrophota bacterium]